MLAAGWWRAAVDSLTVNQMESIELIVIFDDDGAAMGGVLTDSVVMTDTKRCRLARHGERWVVDQACCASGKGRGSCRAWVLKIGT